MNAYDFDNTIYDGDSTLDFYCFCVRKHPTVLYALPAQILGLLQFKLGIIEKRCFKEKFYSFLQYLENVEKDITLFWDSNGYKIKKWYLRQRREDDVIISASPEFLLQDICERLGIKYLIASKVDPRSGECQSANCYGVEKVKRFQEEFPAQVFEKFYSDSYSDMPMTALAKQSFLVNKDAIKRWH